VAQNAELKLLKNVTENVTIASGKTITVDLNGNIWTGAITGGSAIEKGTDNISVRTVTVTFQDDENIVTETSATTRYGQPVTLPTATRAGYTLSWYQGSTLVTATTPITDNVTLTAHWTANTNTEYTVQYIRPALDGSELTESETKTGTTDEKTAAVAKDYKGFTAQAVTQQTIAAEGSTVVNIYYDRNTYTVTFNSNGGTSVGVKTATYGNTITAPASPTRPGYTFAGWYLEGSEFDFGTAIEDNITLIAQWNEKVVVTGTRASNKTTEILPADTDTVANTQLSDVVSETTTTDETTGAVTTTTVLTNGVEIVTVAVPGEPVTATITLPEDVDTATVTIPADVTDSTVAVDTDTGAIIMRSVAIDDGMRVQVEKTTNLTLQDNAKQFADVPADNWAADAVAYATSHELFNGTSADTFSPDGDMTRAMLMTVLARFDGVDTASGATWYEAGINWAVENEISDGTNPDGSITREQLVTMLYRYAGSPTVDGAITGFDDVDSISAYAADAMVWAVQNGILNGINGSLVPQHTASRAQVAAILQRLCALLVK
jgi:uncharacterized repeat protein (TIGR02543 family)